MAQPSVVREKYNPTKVSSHCPSVPAGAVNAVPSKRIIEMSLPKKRAIVATRYIIGPDRIKILNNLMSRIRKSRYQKYRIICNTLAQRAASRERRKRRKLFRFLSKPEDWQRHKQVLERIAVPKQIPQSTSPVFDKGRKKSRPVDLSRIEILAQARDKATTDARDPFAVSPAALRYKITKRMESIAVRKNPPIIISPRIPGMVEPAALKAIASPTIEKLARPAVRPPGKETDLKPNAFSVSPSALKAKCSPIVEKLAQPKTYGKKKK